VVNTIAHSKRNEPNAQLLIVSKTSTLKLLKIVEINVWYLALFLFNGECAGIIIQLNTISDFYRFVSCDKISTLPEMQLMNPQLRQTS
jgi:hypothetical protein